MRKYLKDNPVAAALWANAFVLGGILAVLLAGRGPAFSPAAFAQQPIAGGGGLFLMPAQFATNSFGCYLMDIDNQTLVAYQFSPSDRSLRLVAARDFENDRRLGNYNTFPDPQEIKALADKAADVDRVRPDPR
ncbi:MAG: hypothetical protein ACFCVE_05095 [Phycisphaerae bacterium]